MVVLSCTACSFRCGKRLQLIQHSFYVHSVEPTFFLVCGIRGCSHTFRCGATYSSFKSHASRKHPNWQEHVNEPVDNPDISTSAPDAAQLTEASTDIDIISDVEMNPLDDGSIDGTRTDGRLMSSADAVQTLPPRTCTQQLAVQRTAALFLLTLQERYHVSEAAVNFAVGSIQSIVQGVFEATKTSAEQTSPCIAEMQVDHSDPFVSLKTKYQQSKFYRDVFGLVVSLFVAHAAAVMHIHV